MIIIAGFQSSSKKRSLNYYKYLHVITMWGCFLLKRCFSVRKHVFFLKISSPVLSSEELRSAMAWERLSEPVQENGARTSTSALPCKKAVCVYGDQRIPGAYNWVDTEYSSPPMSQTS